ncbi:MOSC domain-containing protein [Candidatus Uhrbacteria bacterium]|nr:MOSC domain-containing protein [Candidatus Uhrbacteria bacterium]
MFILYTEGCITMVLSGITVYPVKGCAGIAVDRAFVDSRGLAHDRRWMIVTIPDGTFVSQWTVPALAQIRTAYEGEMLRLSAPGGSDLLIPVTGSPGRVAEVTVHGHTCAAVDHGDRVAEWIERALRISGRLVRMVDTFERLVPSRAVRGAQTGFADAFPFLVTNEASLEDLNTRTAARVGVGVTMDRFRPNLVVDGSCTPYEEDQWSRFRIGTIEFVGERPCTRCSVTTVNQQTAERGKEPLATLATYRKQPDGGVTFGLNATHRWIGELRVGMSVEVIERTDDADAVHK